MTWDGAFGLRQVSGEDSASASNILKTKEGCLIRKDHKCGKMLGASKSCFIACPTTDDIEPILALFCEKLAKHGIEAVIAVKERAYGQDIFCTKICGRIIESQFCVALLDDSIVGDVNVPNPNVYYEYGLMTALDKHIIPLQKQGQRLAFNIQSYDTVKYTAANISKEIDRAIGDAILLTEDKEPVHKLSSFPERSIMRRLELAGFKPTTDRWLLRSATRGTAFRSFHHARADCYAFIGKIDRLKDLDLYADDLPVVLKRTEEILLEIHGELPSLSAQVERAQSALARRKSNPLVTPYELEMLETGLRDASDLLRKRETLLSATRNIHVGFLVNPIVEFGGFLESASKALTGYGERFVLAFNEDNEIRFGKIHVSLSG